MATIRLNTKYVVISGGMTVTKPDTQMTRAAGTVDWDQIAIDPSDNQGGFQVSFENDPLVPIHLQKTLTAAAGTDLTAGDVYGKISSGCGRLCQEATEVPRTRK